jgi:hypothetical protein
MNWAEIKIAINSSLGMENFKPLNELLMEGVNELEQNQESD